MLRRSWLLVLSILPCGACSATAASGPPEGGGGGAASASGGLSAGSTSTGGTTESNLGGSSGGVAGAPGQAGAGGTDGAEAGSSGAVGVAGAAGTGAGVGTGGMGGIGGTGGGTSSEEPRSCPTGMVPIPTKNQSFMMGFAPADIPATQGGDTTVWSCFVGQHKVTFTYDLCMDARLVTQADFEALMGFNPSAHQGGDKKLPVDSVTWYDAALFCNARSKRDGLNPAYSYEGTAPAGRATTNLSAVALNLKANGYRLPTNAEYEYAERANTTGFYFFSPTAGSNLNTLAQPYAWGAATGANGVTHPVGEKLPNPWGLYDIIGNVFEWLNDWEAPYSTVDEVDPVGASAPDGGACANGLAAQGLKWGGDFGNNGKMAKGGSWKTDVQWHMRISYHYKWPPGTIGSELGFRCAATLP